jgi:hypothetical protein
MKITKTANAYKLKISTNQWLDIGVNMGWITAETAKKWKGKGGKGKPYWKGYKQVGMKEKGNKQVPNCVPE